MNCKIKCDEGEIGFKETFMELKILNNYSYVENKVEIGNLIQINTNRITQVIMPRSTFKYEEVKNEVIEKIC